MVNTTKKLFILFFVCTGTLTCSGTPNKTDAPEHSPESTIISSKKDKETTLYLEIESLYNNNDYNEVLKKLNTFEKKFPNGKLIAKAHNINGLTHLKKNKFLQAIHHFKKSTELNTDMQFRSFLLYNLAVAQFEANQLEETRQTIEKITPEQLTPTIRSKFHFLKARVNHKLGFTSDSIREILLTEKLPMAEQTSSLFETQLKISLKAAKDISELESIYHENESSKYADLLLFELGEKSHQQNQFGLAESYLHILISKFPNSATVTRATEILRTVHEQAIVDPNKIGILLPMSGRFEKFGEQSLHAIALAFRIFNLDEPDSKVTLIIEDSGETKEQAIHAINELYFTHHVVAILGPLLSKDIQEITRRAQELGIPMISLAQQNGTNGDYVFYASVTPEHQSYEIARHAIQHAGLKKFAIAYPDDKFGTEYTHYFWNAVESLGGQIVGVELYPEKETDFRKIIDKLSGLYYQAARQRELDSLAKLREENAITQKNQKTIQYYELPPVVDYDAVFIPDEAKTVGQILPTFAFRDIENIRFLGTATWNSSLLVSRAQNYAEGSIFVDAFYPKSDNPEVQNFIAKYQNVFGNQPTVIDALSYDAASLLEKTLLMTSTPIKRSELRTLLTSVKDFPGVTGKISYQNGQFFRTLKILSIKNGQITELNNF